MGSVTASFYKILMSLFPNGYAVLFPLVRRDRKVVLLMVQETLSCLKVRVHTLRLFEVLIPPN